MGMLVALGVLFRGQYALQLHMHYTLASCNSSKKRFGIVLLVLLSSSIKNGI